MSKSDIEAYDKFRDEVTAVPGKLAILQRYLDAGFDQASPTYLKKAARGIARATGIEFGVDLDKLTEIDQIRSRLVLELARELLKDKVRLQKVNVLSRLEPMPTRKERHQKPSRNWWISCMPVSNVRSISFGITRKENRRT